MFPIFLWIFCACMLYNYVASGGSFKLFSGAVDVMRSFREKTPRNARVGRDSLFIEFALGKDRLYTIIFPKRDPIPWEKVAAYDGTKWVPVTKEIAHCAGPYKNFYEIPITPAHINESFRKLGFEVPGMDPVIINHDQYIIAELRRAFRKK